ncbi:MAG: DUF4347 domain-containing protein, partial [Thermoanaerobaculia bacterium]
MGGAAKAKQQRSKGESPPARTLAPSKDSRAKKAAPAKARTRKLPIRSSPVSTAPSLRSTLEALKGGSAKGRSSPTPAKAPPPFASKPVLEELESRLLLSADLNPLATDALLAAPSTLPAEFRSLTDVGKPSVVTSAAVAPIHRSNELVFVDTAVPEYQKLVEDMRAAAVAEGRNLEFVLIEQGRDGIRKITDTLAQKSDLDAVHIISHSDAGNLQLGAAVLDFDALVKRAGAIKKWGDALTENGDILIYGCDLAATQEGKSLVEALSRLTGADVAASEDRTGAAAKGGDWDLEFKSGAIETGLGVSAAEQARYGGILQGTAAGGETRVNTTTVGVQTTDPDPLRAVAMDSSGNYVVVWAGNGTQAGNVDADGVFFRRYDRNGLPLSGETRVNSAPAGNQFEPTVAMDTAGNFVVVWGSGNGAAQDVYAQRYNAAGAAQGGNFLVNTYTTDRQSTANVAMNAAGQFVIAWSSMGQDNADGLAGSYAKTYNADGSVNLGEFQVNTTTTAGNQWADGVAIDSAGNFIVVMSIENNPSDASGYGAFTRR